MAGTQAKASEAVARLSDRVTLGADSREAALEDYSYLRIRRGISLYAEEVAATETGGDEG